MAFYVELYADEYGNLAWTTPQPMVVEGEIEHTPHGDKLVFRGDFAKKHPSVYLKHYGGWAEVPGPSRTLSRKEHAQMVRGLTRIKG